MTILDLLKHYYAAAVYSEGVSPSFSAEGPEFMAVELGGLFISIDRKSRRFAAQRGDVTVRGSTDSCLTSDELEALRRG